MPIISRSVSSPAPPDDRRRNGVDDDQVVAVAAVERVARAAEQRVVAVAADELVRPAIADQRVVALPALEAVVGVLAGQRDRRRPRPRISVPSVNPVSHVVGKSEPTTLFGRVSVTLENTAGPTVSP